MTKKKRKHPDVDEVLQRPWCYYCERDFDDLKILISHQKAKHFKCERCGRRLNTAGGLAVHMNQVHKESLNHVENALPNRQGLDQEIFGMEGIPDDIVDTHRQRVIQQYYEDEANRRAATGNPPPGTVSGSQPKKARYESMEEMKKRLADFRIRKSTGQLGGEVKPPAPAVQSPGHSNSPAPFPQAGSPPFAQPPFAAPPQASPPLGTSYHQQPPFQPPFAQQPPGFPGAPPPGFPGAPGMAGLPQRLPQAHDPSATASAVDDLISSVTNGQSGFTDSAATGAPADAAKEKKGKDKNTRLVYSDNEVSPEEKMSQLGKYSFQRRGEDVVLGEVGAAVTGITVGPDDVVDKMG